MIEQWRVHEQPAFTRPGEHPALAVPPSKPESALPRPHLDYDVRAGVWRLEADYTIRHLDYDLTIPAGFTLDLASVPRALWVVMSNTDLGLIGPLVHDFLYEHQGRVRQWTEKPREYTRAESDGVFNDVMRLEGVATWRRQLGYRAVRWFGWLAWRRKGTR